MSLTKQDYENILLVMESAKVDGLTSAKYFASLGAKIEAKIAEFNAPVDIDGRTGEPVRMPSASLIPLNRE